MKAKKDMVLFCRSGGGLPGLDIHAGITTALEAAGIRADVVHGTSAGAIISAMDSCGMSAAEISRAVQQFESNDVIDYRFLWRIRAGWLSHIVRGSAMRQAMCDTLPHTWSAYCKPISVWATQADTSRRINAWRIAQSPIDALMMSAAIPAVFPPVPGGDGHHYVDGGVRCNLPLPADWQAYREVWLLIATGAPDKTAPSRSTLGNLLRIYRHLMADQILDVLDATDGAPSVRVVWPRMTTFGTLKFDHDMILGARLLTSEMLRSYNYRAA